MKIQNPFKKFRILKEEQLKKMVDDAANDANAILLEKIRGFDEFDSFFNYMNGDYQDKENVFNEKMFKGVKKVNEEVKNILLSAFDSPFSADLGFEELNLIQSAIWNKYITDPLIQGGVDNYVDYVIGSGVTVSTPVEEVNAVFRQFEKQNKWFLRQREIVKNSFIDGEHFTLLFNNSQGDVFVRKCHPASIESMETAESDYEILYDIYRRLAKYDEFGNVKYSDQKQYIKSLDYDMYQKMGLGYNQSNFEGQFLKNCVVDHLKLNDSDKLRGLPPLKRVLKWSKLYENFIMDRMVLNHERAKVVWIKKYTQRSREALPDKPYKSPAQGTMLVEKDGIEYRTEKPNLDSSEAKEDGLGLLYYIGTTFRFPLHILNQRTDQQVYASIRKADTPFQKMIESAQFYYAYYFERIYRHLIEQKVARKKLDKEYKYPSYSEEALLTAVKEINDGILEGKPVEDIKNAVGKTLENGKELVSTKTVDIPISQDFQQMLLQDPKEMAEVLKIHNEIGIASKATLSAKAGYLWKREFPKLMAEFSVSMENKKKETEATALPEPTVKKPKEK
jgi:hypothetical protein